MTRLLFWIALIVLVVMAVRSKLRAMTAPRSPGPVPGPQPNMQPGAQPGAQANWQRVPDQSERMSCCAQCGVYFPSSEAVSANGREYCCAAHARH
ncbi:PP0621 family protein [Massilia sp. 9096]|uniref:PP0621 family protein n=1 Tax=Massilia sp. 9096 TaxID=1500894 RepID=UPI0005686A4C|nr:PP0621 family protein [Massilia sp. 9096]